MIYFVVSLNIPGFHKFHTKTTAKQICSSRSQTLDLQEKTILSDLRSRQNVKQSMVTLLMNLRSVGGERVFVFIKPLANVTFVRLRPLVNSHEVPSFRARRGEQFGA